MHAKLKCAHSNSTTLCAATPPPRNPPRTTAYPPTRIYTSYLRHCRACAISPYRPSYGRHFTQTRCRPPPRRHRPDKPVHERSASISYPWQLGDIVLRWCAAQFFVSSSGAHGTAGHVGRCSLSLNCCVSDPGPQQGCRPPLARQQPAGALHLSTPMRLGRQKRRGSRLPRRWRVQRGRRHVRSGVRRAITRPPQPRCSPRWDNGGRECR